MAMKLEAAEAVAAGAAAAAVSLGAIPIQVAQAVLVAMRSLPIAAAHLQAPPVFDMTCGQKDCCDERQTSGAAAIPPVMEIWKWKCLGH